MKKLINSSEKIVIAEHIETADTAWKRLKGLLGRSTLADKHGLWITPCNSIHTCFMKFSIDVVFVDKNMKVKSIKKNLGPWKFVPPTWGANSVFEFAAGTLEKTKLKVGDQLHVGT